MGAVTIYSFSPGIGKELYEEIEILVKRVRLKCHPIAGMGTKKKYPKCPKPLPLPSKSNNGEPVACSPAVFLHEYAARAAPHISWVVCEVFR